MSRLQIDLTPDLDKRIAEEARKRGVSPSDVVRLSLEELFPTPAPQNPLKRNIMEFAGIGRGAWQGMDIDQHINNMRDEWDQPHA